MRSLLAREEVAEPIMRFSRVVLYVLYLLRIFMSVLGIDLPIHVDRWRIINALLLLFIIIEVFCLRVIQQQAYR